MNTRQNGRSSLRLLTACGLVAASLGVCSVVTRAAEGPLGWAAYIDTTFVTIPGITYLTASNWEAKLDLFKFRTASRPAPTLIYIHGGGWTGGAREDRTIGILPYLQMGMNVVNIDYRLASVALAPAAVEDSRCALRWVMQHAKEHAFDTDRIVVAGQSAGGHLALTTGLLQASAGLDRLCPGPDNLKVAAIVNWFGISDVPELLDGPNLRTFAVEWFGGISDREQLAKRVSPMTYIRQGAPPVLTIHGDADPTVPYAQSVRLHKALTDAGVANELVTVPGGRHGNACCDLAQRTNAYERIRAFLTTHHVLSAQAR